MAGRRCSSRFFSGCGAPRLARCGERNRTPDRVRCRTVGAPGSPDPRGRTHPTPRARSGSPRAAGRGKDARQVARRRVAPRPGRRTGRPLASVAEPAEPSKRGAEGARPAEDVTRFGGIAGSAGHELPFLPLRGQRGWGRGWGRGGGFGTRHRQPMAPGAFGRAADVRCRIAGGAENASPEKKFGYKPWGHLAATFPPALPRGRVPGPPERRRDTHAPSEDGLR